MESASECDIGQAKRKVHLVLVKALCQQLYSRLGHNWHNLAPDCDVAVQELNMELTVLHSIKLVKAMLQGAGVVPGALLHTVHSMGLITC